MSPDGPYEFILNGDSPFFKILDFTRLVGEFKLIKPDGSQLEKAAEVSFVNNQGHSWIQQIEVYLNDKQVVETKILPEPSSANMSRE